MLGGTVTTRTIAHAPVYHADFAAPLGAEWSGTFTREAVQGYAGYGGAGLLLRTGATSAAPLRLTLTGLPAHTSVSLRMLLAIIDSWDGAVSCGHAGPDTLTIRVDGITRLSGVFENSGCGVQTYAAAPYVTLARHVGLGFAGDGGYFNDSAYNLGFDPAVTDIPHTGSTLTIEWYAGGVWQGINDESFGIDNLDVVLGGVVPVEPPVADAGGPYAVDEGSQVTLDGSAIGGTAPYTYAWDLDGDGAYDDATGAAPAFTPADGPASVPVVVRVTDAAGTTDTDTASVVVGNVAPTATLAVDPAAVTEGDPFTVSLTKSRRPLPDGHGSGLHVPLRLR